ncbi:MAG: HalOD1 output domain-containing protein [Natrialbaceae archaeon]|nr:HalOD1 output domain-containing protein [Natrialbaceae archaeon]
MGPPLAEASFEDFASDRPSDAVISLIADYTGEDALELPSLYHTIDTDALDLLLEGTEGVRVSFSYAGHEIECGDGAICVYRTRPRIPLILPPASRAPSEPGRRKALYTAPVLVSGE